MQYSLLFIFFAIMHLHTVQDTLEIYARAISDYIMISRAYNKEKNSWPVKGASYYNTQPKSADLDRETNYEN